MEKLISLVGLFVMVAIAVLFSSNRKAIAWKTVGAGLFLQVLFGVFILRVPFGMKIFESMKTAATSFLSYTNEGSNFLFGSLADGSKVGFVFLTMVLPTIIFFSSVMAVLYHFGVMQIIVKAVAKLMMKTMGTSGPESLAAAANIFLGQTEAPLTIKPYINKMSQSEIMTLMTGGMATVAGGVLAAYVGMGIDAGHLLAASVMSAPAALICAKIIVPEKPGAEINKSTDLKNVIQYENALEAATSGAGEGLFLALNVGAMLLAFVALIAMFNGILSSLGSLVGLENLSFELISSYLFAPIAFLMGVPWEECLQVGALLGKKLFLNEFMAYADLEKLLPTFSQRAAVISTYALCGFANFSSIAIQIGGIGSLVPERKTDLAKLGMRSLLGGTLACLMTACVAGLFI